MADSREKFLDPKAMEALRNFGLESTRQVVIVPAREVKPWYMGVPTPALLGALYVVVLELLKPLMNRDLGMILGIGVFIVGFQIREIRKKIGGDTTANSEGIRYKGVKGEKWELAWSQITGVRVQSKPESTILYTIEGDEKRLPFALVGPTQFDHNVNSLKQMFEGHGLTIAYSIVEPALIPKRKFTLSQANMVRNVSVAFLFISMIFTAVYSDKYRHHAFTWIMAMPVIVCIAVGLGIFWLSQGMRGWIRAALSADGEIQAGEPNSLYRQLTGRSLPAYGCYRYPEDIAGRDSFNLGCSDPKSVVESTIRELYWTKEGLRLTPRGPICGHSIRYHANSDGRLTMSLMVVPPNWNPSEAKPSTSQRLGTWLAMKLIKLPAPSLPDADGSTQLRSAYNSVPKFDPRYLELVEE